MASEMQANVLDKYLAFCREVGCLCSRYTEEALYYIAPQEDDDAFLREVAKVHATLAVWLRSNHGKRE